MAAEKERRVNATPTLRCCAGWERTRCQYRSCYNVYSMLLHMLVSLYLPVCDSRGNVVCLEPGELCSSAIEIWRASSFSICACCGMVVKHGGWKGCRKWPSFYQGHKGKMGAGGWGEWRQKGIWAQNQKMVLHLFSLSVTPLKYSKK